MGARNEAAKTVRAVELQARAIDFEESLRDGQPHLQQIAVVESFAEAAARLADAAAHLEQMYRQEADIRGSEERHSVEDRSVDSSAAAAVGFRQAADALRDLAVNGEGLTARAG